LSRKHSHHDGRVPGYPAPRFRRRGIYLLPNLFTTAALFAGFFAITSARDGRFELAAIAIFVAMVLDGLDGRVARLTHTESDFGAQYDSLSDVVSFGLAPALIMYDWALQPLANLGWLAVFIYAAATALRLARFNSQLGSADKRYFTGLACPSAAAVMMGLVWVGEDLGLDGQQLVWVALCLTVISGVLMVSNILYLSFKAVDLKGRIPFVALLAIVLGLGFASMDPPKVLFGLALGYALSGPAMSLWRRRQRAIRRRHQHELDQPRED